MDRNLPAEMLAELPAGRRSARDWFGADRIRISQWKRQVPYHLPAAFGLEASRAQRPKAVPAAPLFEEIGRLT
jgi:hypothetical protein